MFLHRLINWFRFRRSHGIVYEAFGVKYDPIVLWKSLVNDEEVDVLQEFVILNGSESSEDANEAFEKIVATGRRAFGVHGDLMKGGVTSFTVFEEVARFLRFANDVKKKLWLPHYRSRILASEGSEDTDGNHGSNSESNSTET